MVNLLAEILRRKREDVAELLRTRSENSIRNVALRVREDAEPHRLRNALEAKDPELKIIAEYKRRSPSKGLMRDDLQPAEVASLYRNAGACAISVLTEKHFFGGSIDDLVEVYAATLLPLLRKDFIFHPVQLFEAAEAGADAVLLIAAALDEEALRDLRSITEDELGLDALVEVHTKEEMQRAVNCGAHLIGINNRDLTTFEVSISTSEALVHHAPQNALLISESGLSARDELCRLRQLGFDGFLIGERLMRADNPGDALRKLLETTKAGRHAAPVRPDDRNAN
ncbi:MAG: indole-3-glycerol phosphate synthase TrpC [Verrucomicrobiota bacterium]|nr:indole-3-glycerol phosphate synthase TrpC [Verrucomicrobiota bacterium]